MPPEIAASVKAGVLAVKNGVTLPRDMGVTWKWRRIKTSALRWATMRVIWSVAWPASRIDAHGRRT